MAVDPRRRLLVTSVSVALIVALLGGWLWARADDPDASSSVSTFPASGDTVVEPGIKTNADVEGTPLPDVEVEALDGTATSTSALVGTPMVVNIWYSTCPPCRRELPGFAAAATDYADQVRFIGINPFDSPDRAQSFLDEIGVSYDTYLDPDGRFLTDAGIGTFPSTLFVSADGTIVAQKAGELAEDELRRVIDEQLLS